MKNLLWPVVVLFALTVLAMVMTTHRPTVLNPLETRMREAERKARLAGVPLTAAQVRHLPLDPTRANIAAYCKLNVDQPGTLPVGLAESSTFDLELDLDKPWVTYSEVFPFLKQTARSLRESSVRQARIGKHSEALRGFLAIHNLALVTTQDGTVLSVLTAIAIDMEATECGKDILLSAVDRPDVLQTLAKGMTDFTFDARHVWSRESYMVVAFARNYDAAEAAHDAIQEMQGRVHADSQEVETIIPENQVLRSGWPLSNAGRTTLAQRLEGLARTYSKLGRTTEPVAFMKDLAKASEGTFPEWPGLFARTANLTLDQRARNRCLRAAALATAYRAKTGSLPPSLSEAGINEKDPHTGASLHYSSNGTTIKLWSVGQDTTDNGGTRVGQVSPDDLGNGDIVFELTLPQSRAK